MAEYLGYPFDPELFMYSWGNEPDPTKTALLESGVMVEDAGIANLISNGSDFYTVPFYNTITGAPANYDGKTDIPVTDSKGASASGVVFGRTQGWSENQFVRDYNSGADPMNAQVIPQVARFWQKQDQKLILGMLEGLSGVSEISSHVIDTASAIEATTLGDAAVDALGDNNDVLTMAFMHSKVANQLANLQMLEYAKYTDAQGIERTNRKIGYVDGLLVIIDDNAPYTKGSTSTIYLLGQGFLRHADAPVEVPVEVSRDPQTNGGINTLYTRRRQTIHPNGFSFTKPADYTASATDAQLTASANWSLVYDEKSIPFAAVKVTV